VQDARRLLESQCEEVHAHADRENDFVVFRRRTA
jgi:hypothetical protein